jgi:hypothetical protein
MWGERNLSLKRRIMVRGWEASREQTFLNKPEHHTSRMLDNIIVSCELFSEVN